MSNLITTYKTEKDDDGNEALFMNALVHNHVVELDWIHEEDGLEACAQRGLTRVKTISNPDSSFVPQSAFLTMRLYRRGDVKVSGIACAEGYGDQAIRLAKEAAIEMYDTVYADVAREAQAFVEEYSENVKRVGLDLLPALEAGVGEQLEPDQFLPRLLDKAKAELVKTGEVVQQIGWLVDGGMALFPIGPPPLEKHRFFGQWRR